MSRTVDALKTALASRSVTIRANPENPRYNPAAVTFEDYRRSALDSYRRGALTWEKPEDAVASILFAADTTIQDGRARSILERYPSIAS